MMNPYNTGFFKQFSNAVFAGSFLYALKSLARLRIIILLAGFIIVLPLIGQPHSSDSPWINYPNRINAGIPSVSTVLAAPTAGNDNYNTNEDIPLNIAAPGVLANDGDADGDIISITAFDGVSANGGVVVLNGNGSFTYTPPTNYNGNDTFTYTIDDGNSGTATGTVTIALAPINDNPLVIGDAYFTTEDNTLNVNTVVNGVLKNDSDIEGSPLTVSAFDATSINGGSIIMTIDGRFSYSPAADFNGTDTFNYTASDGNGGVSSAVVTITVIPINDDPVAGDDPYVIDEDTPLSIVAPGVLGNDSDPENNSLIISSFNSVSVQGGIVVVNPNGSFTYTPPSNFFGTDTFNYSIDDGNGGSASATVSFTIAPVNDDPQAVDDTYTTDEDTNLNVSAPGVLINDKDVDLDAVTVTSFDATSINGGTITMNPNGSFIYSPPTNFNGPDTFTYRIADGNGGTAMGTVNIAVVPVNDDPLALEDAYVTDEDTPLSIVAPGVLANDSDLEDALTVGSFDVISIKGGAVAMNADGSFTYTPPADFSGTDTFTYSAEDGNGGSASALVTITVNPINDNPQTVDNTYSTDEDTPLAVAAPGTLANDSDIDGDSLTVSDYQAMSTNGGTIVMNPDGSFVYTPPVDFNGSDTFTYTVSDGNGGTSVATVTINVLPINDNPLALDDAYSTEKNIPINISVPGVLINDSDVEDDILVVATYDAVSPNGGVVVMNPDGSFNFTPGSDFNGNDTFTYTIDDGNGGSAIATVTIAVAVPNSLPLAVDDSYETQQDIPLQVDVTSDGVLANDTDPDGDNLATAVVTDATTTNGGLITINSDGTFQYAPPVGGSVGTDTYQYTVCDDGIPNQCSTAVISILIKEGLFTFNTGFTPNGDGFNDTWTIGGILTYPNNVVQIYNRWGNLIYQVEGYNNNDKVWRGESNQGIILGDRQAPSGSYYFLVDSGDGSKPLSGYVVLVR